MSAPEEGSTRFDGPEDRTHDDLPPTEPQESLSPEFGIGEARLLADLRLLPSPLPSALGRLGHYDVMTFVGAGAMGTVLKAFDSELHRAVAIKVLSSHLITSEAARQRFVREAQNAATINHPNVVTIHAIASHNGVPYIVMEYVDGASLQQRIERDAPMFTIDILRLSAQIAGGLAAAHAHGVIHRDIKPANIMLEDHVERVKITDFGLAKAALANSDLTSFGKMVGTPAFMSPEQVTGDPLDGRSDLFSLGCVMYAMVAGNSPFRGGNCLAVAHNITTETHRPLREKFPQAPRFLEDIIHRLLEKDPNNRFQSADELATELTQRLAQLNQLDSKAILTDLPRTTVLSMPRPAPRQGRRALWTGGAAVAAVLAAVALWRPRSGDDLTGSGSPGGGAGVSAAAAVPEEPDEPLPPSGAVLTVGEQPQAGYATIQDALDAAQPGALIQVLDDRVYQEPLRIDAKRHRGLTLEAIAGATLEAPGGTSVITLAGVSDVTLRGLRCRLKMAQHGVEVLGRCPGAVIDGVHFEQPAAASLAFLYLHMGAAGTERRPIVIRNLNVRCGGVGIVLQGEPGKPVQWVRIEENRITGPGIDQSVNLVLQGALQNIVIARNLVFNGRSGLVLELRDGGAAVNIAVSHNTFQNLKHVLTLQDTPLEGQQLSFNANLILDTGGVQWGAQSMDLVPATWFEGNVWEEGNCNRREAQVVARLVGSVPTVSRDATHADFLKPTADALPELGEDAPFPGRFPRPE